MKGCSNHSCDIKKPKGMGTNGPCHCLDAIKHEDKERWFYLRHKIKALEAVADAVEEFVVKGGNFEELDKALKNWQRVRES